MPPPRPLTPRARIALLKDALATARGAGYAEVEVEITEGGGVRLKGRAEPISGGDAADAWLAAHGPR